MTFYGKEEVTPTLFIHESYMIFLHFGMRIIGLHNCDVLTRVIDFAHILMYIRVRKRDNVKEGVPLPISQRWNIKA